MKNRKRIIEILSVFILLIGVLCGRIYYVNNVEYHIPEREVYHIGDVISYNGLEVTVCDYKIYSAEELNAAYDNQTESDANDFSDDFDLVFNLTIKNTSSETKSFNAVATGMMYGNKYGGNVNPYLYSYFNPNTPGTLELEPETTKTVTLIFPYEADILCDSSRYIFSLYPRNISVMLNK